MSKQLSDLRVIMLKAEELAYCLIQLRDDADKLLAKVRESGAGLLPTYLNRAEAHIRDGASDLYRFADEAMGALIETGHRSGLTDDQSIGDGPDDAVPGTQATPTLKPTGKPGKK